MFCPMIVCKIFVSFLSLLKAQIVKSSHILSGIYFVKTIKLGEDWTELEAKKLFPETIIDKIYETSCSFYKK